MDDASLYTPVDFSAKEDKQELSWSGRNEIGGRAEDIAELVVGQFPDVEFRISVFVTLAVSTSSSAFQRTAKSNGLN